MAARTHSPDPLPTLLDKTQEMPDVTPARCEPPFKMSKKICNSLCADTTLPIKCQSKATMELICGSHHCTQPITPRKPLSCGRNRLIWVECQARDPNPACIISTGLEHRQSLLSISIGQIPDTEGENFPDDQLQKTGTRIPSLAEEVG